MPRYKITNPYYAGYGRYTHASRQQPAIVEVPEGTKVDPKWEEVTADVVPPIPGVPHKPGATAMSEVATRNLERDRAQADRLHPQKAPRPDSQAGRNTGPLKDPKDSPM